MSQTQPRKTLGLGLLGLRSEPKISPPIARCLLIKFGDKSECHILYMSFVLWMETGNENKFLEIFLIHFESTLKCSKMYSCLFMSGRTLSGSIWLCSGKLFSFLKFCLKSTPSDSKPFQAILGEIIFSPYFRDFASFENVYKCYGLSRVNNVCYVWYVS